VEDRFNPSLRPSETTPEVDEEREKICAFADFIARLLDSVIRIPGTPIRIGLDPLLGLIPGLGDVVANLIGSTLLFLAVRIQAPKIVISRMALNMVINTVVGAIPGLGDLFSIWYKSNVKNAELLRRSTTGAPPRSTGGDWLFVIGLVLGTFTLAIGLILAIIWIIRILWGLTL